MQETTDGATLYISEVADYEVRRELTLMIRTGKLPASRPARLDRLTSFFTFLPVSTGMWKRAAEFWAEARQQGVPTAGPGRLDADVLIAAQAAEVGATVVTSNTAHFNRWVPVHPWP